MPNFFSFGKQAKKKRTRTPQEIKESEARVRLAADKIRQLEYEIEKKKLDAKLAIEETEMEHKHEMEILNSEIEGNHFSRFQCIVPSLIVVAILLIGCAALVYLNSAMQKSKLDMEYQLKMQKVKREKEAEAMSHAFDLQMQQQQVDLELKRKTLDKEIEQEKLEKHLQMELQKKAMEQKVLIAQEETERTKMESEKAKHETEMDVQLKKHEMDMEREQFEFQVKQSMYTQWWENATFTAQSVLAAAVVIFFFHLLFGVCGSSMQWENRLRMMDHIDKIPEKRRMEYFDKLLEPVKNKQSAKPMLSIESKSNPATVEHSGTNGSALTEEVGETMSKNANADAFKYNIPPKAGADCLKDAILFDLPTPQSAQVSDHSRCEGSVRKPQSDQNEVSA